MHSRLVAANMDLVTRQEPIRSCVGLCQPMPELGYNHEMGDGEELDGHGSNAGAGQELDSGETGSDESGGDENAMGGMISVV